MIQHDSDCAVHNDPALPPGPCDCGAQAKYERRWLAYLYQRGCTHLTRRRIAFGTWLGRRFCQARTDATRALCLTCYRLLFVSAQRGTPCGGGAEQERLNDVQESIVCECHHPALLNRLSKHVINTHVFSSEVVEQSRTVRAATSSAYPRGRFQLQPVRKSGLRLTFRIMD